MKECKQIPTTYHPCRVARGTTPHENKNPTNKKNSEEKTFSLNRGNDRKPLSRRYKNKKNPRV
jgi:hypothetical protein